MGLDDGGRIGFKKGTRTDLEWVKVNHGTVKDQSNIYWRDLKNSKTGKVKRVYDVRITQNTQIGEGPQKGKRTTGTGRYKNLISERDLTSLDDAIAIRNNFRADNPMNLGAGKPGKIPPDEKAKKLKIEKKAAIKKKGGYYSGPHTGTVKTHLGHTGNVWGTERITGDRLAYTPKNINEAMAAERVGLDHKIRKVSEKIEKIKKQKIPNAMKKKLLEVEDALLVRLASQSQGFKKVQLSDGSTFGGDRLTIDTFNEFPGKTEREINEFVKKWKDKKTWNTAEEFNNIKKATLFEANRKSSLKAASKIGNKEQKKILDQVTKVFKKKGINLRKGEQGFIATEMLKDFGKMGVKGLKLLNWLQFEYDVVFESLIYQYHRQYEGHEPELAREGLFVPKILAKYFPDLSKLPFVGDLFKPYKTGIMEGPEKILEERLGEKNELVKNYIDNNKRMEEISSKWDNLDFEKNIKSGRRPGESYYAEPFAHPRLDTIVNEQRRLENEYNQLDQLNKPDALTGYHTAYQMAKEKQDTEYGVKATEAHKKRLGVKDYPWDIENPNEMLKYDKNKEKKLERAQERFEKEQANKRRRAIEDKYPTLTKYEIDKKLEDVGLYIDTNLRSYKGQTVQRPEGLKFLKGVDYDYVSDYWKDLDKQSYYADNFRTEKAEGGIMNLKKKW